MEVLKNAQLELQNRKEQTQMEWMPNMAKHGMRLSFVRDVTTQTQPISSLS